MTPHERYVRALRDAADAYEEANCGAKPKARRHRGPVKTEGVEVPEELRRRVRAQLHRAGLSKVGA